MAYLSMHTYSYELKMTTLINLFIPDSPKMDIPMSERKTLYLLHGLSDNATAWVRRSNIEVYAEKYGLIVVMPSADRSFYCDGVNGMNYFSYITKELPLYLNRVLNISMDRDKNLIAGLSMGGYGAMKMALSFPEKYFAVGSFSGVLDIEPLVKDASPEIIQQFPFLLKENEDPATSTNNPISLLKKDIDILMYVSCGLQDNLLITSKNFEERAQSLGIKAKFVYEDGAHTWPFWDRHISLFLDFVLKE